MPDFAGESRGFLWDNAFRQGKENLAEGRELKDTESKMAAFFADFNVAYIAGRSDLIPWDDEILKMWEKTDSFVPYYFRLVQEEGSQDYTVYDIDLGQ